MNETVVTLQPIHLQVGHISDSSLFLIDFDKQFQKIAETLFALPKYSVQRSFQEHT